MFSPEAVAGRVHLLLAKPDFLVLWCAFSRVSREDEVEDIQKVGALSLNLRLELQSGPGAVSLDSGV